MIFNLGNYPVSVGEVPSPSGNLTYNGSVQSPVWNNYDPARLDIGGVASAVDAGTYTATFTPKMGFKWNDGTKESKSVSWQILEAVIGTVPSPSGSFIYNGSQQSPVWLNFDSLQLTICGITSAVDAGTYTATFTPKKGYKWSDGTFEEKSVQWSIDRAPVSDVPSQSGSLTYTGSPLSPVWLHYDPAQLILSGDTDAVNAGDYWASFAPSANYKWSDGTVDAKSVKWTIGKAAGSLSISPTSLSLTSSAKSKKITVTRSGDGAISAKSSNTGIATISVSGNQITVTAVKTGSCTVTVSVAEGTNHTAPANKTCSVTAQLTIVLYGSGEDTSVTGGWDGTPNNLYSTGWENDYAETNKKISLAGYNTLYVTGKCDGAGRMFVGLYNSDWSSLVEFKKQTNQSTKSVDVSGISGSFYIRCDCNANGGGGTWGAASKIWLE